MVEGGASSLSKLDILVAQLESTVASAASQHPDPLICFDLLSDLLSSLQDHTKEAIVTCQRKCEDALQNLLLLGARPPVRRLAAKVLIKLIEKGDNISIYARASSLQGWLSDTRKADSSSYIGATNCLGALYRTFGQKISSGLSETSNIVVKLMKFPEVSVRQAALQLLQDAVEGCGGGGSAAAYAETLRAVSRIVIVDKFPQVRTAAAGCLRVFALAGGPGLGSGGLENCCALCVKALDDPSQSVRDAFATALGSLLALGLNPEAQIPTWGKSHTTPTKTLEGGLQKHLIGPFMRASGPLSHDVRMGLTMAWVAFLQGMHLTYGHSDMELQNYALQVMGMLTFDSKSQTDVHSQACVLYILRVGVIEQMSEPVQKEFLFLLTKQLSLADTSSSMLVVILRTISYLLATLGEVSTAAREALENCLVVMLSNSTVTVRVETAMTMRALAEVDPSCAYNLMSFGVATMRALREVVVIERGDRFRLELDSLHGHAMMLAALSTASAKLPLGVPSRLPAAILEVAKTLVLENGRNPSSAGMEKEAGWILIAAIVSCLTQEELKDQQFDIIALWTVPFGGNSESRLKKAETNLKAEICGWSAAVEALTAFVRSYVNPNLSSQKEGILLQPVLGYLNGALTYLSSSLLQRASEDLKQTVDLFMIRTLAAYQALPDPLAYRTDHNVLLNICIAPFRDPSLWGQCSSLRQLLDNRDASLGPWIPGRDSSEDELRAFEGGSDGPLPHVWESDATVFPQPLSLATSLLNQMMLGFGLVFSVQKESRKLQLLDVVENSFRSSKKQGWHEANTTNVSVALLAAVKVALGLRVEYEPEVFRRLQLIFQEILADEVSNSAQRRAAAEGLGILARLGNDVFAARLMRSLLAETASASDSSLKGSLAFACGCVHRSKGGMALSVLVPVTVQTMCMMAKDLKDSFCIWPLHGLWLTIEAAGLAYVPYVQATMSLAMDILLSEEHDGPELQQSLGRLVNAIVAVTGPELSPGSSFFSRCKSLVADVMSGVEPAVLLESVKFTQQLVLFAPQAVPVHVHVHTLTSTLRSRQPALRQAAVATLHHLAERDPESMIDEHIEENLFAMLDTETDVGIIKLIRLSLRCLLEAACPCYPSRWLHLCRNVILAATTTIAAGGKNEFTDNGSTKSGETPSIEQTFGDDEEGMIVRPEKWTQESSWSGGFPIADMRPKEGEQLPRYSTRLFAVECLSRLLEAVSDNPKHFSILLAKEVDSKKKTLKNTGDWLVLQLGQLVSLAYQVATGIFESMRPKGVLILVNILQKFGSTEDPDLSGHLLLEQYQAQFVSAGRTALDSSAGPTLLEAGLQLAARVITSGISDNDVGVYRRMITLMSRLLNNFEDLQYPSYAELVGCKVQISLLGAYASIRSYANASIGKSSYGANGTMSLIELLANNSVKVKEFWIGLLKDYSAICIASPSQLQMKYKPFLNGLLLPTVASTIRPLLEEVVPAVLEAVTTNTTSELVDRTHHFRDAKEKLTVKHQTLLSNADFQQIWAVCFFFISGTNRRVIRKLSSQNSFSAICLKECMSRLECGFWDEQIVAIHAVYSLCRPEFFHPTMITMEICQELCQVLSDICFTAPLTASIYIIPILNQIVKTAPAVFFTENDDDWLLNAVEIFVYCYHQALHRITTQGLSSLMEVDRIICLIFEALENAMYQLVYERHSQVAPVIMSIGMSFITLELKTESCFPAALALLSKAVTLLIQAKVEEQQAVLISMVHGLASFIQISVINKNGENGPANDVETRITKLLMLLGLMVEISEMLMTDTVQWHIARKVVLKDCTECIHCTLTSPECETQIAGLQILRSLAQRSISDNKQGVNYVLSLVLFQDLGSSIVDIINRRMKIPLTAKAAMAVGESLKLLVLLHSLVVGEDAQREVLHVLLPAIISAASADAKDEFQIAAGLKTVAIKFVTHIASDPDGAAQFRNAVMEMRVDLRQKLQDIIRASISHTTSTILVGPSSFPAASQRFVIPMSSVASSLQAAKQSSVNILKEGDNNDQDEDDDWDEFQSFSAPEVQQNHSEHIEKAEEQKGQTADEAAEKSDQHIVGMREYSDEDDFDFFQGETSTEFSCEPTASQSPIEDENSFETFTGRPSATCHTPVALTDVDKEQEENPATSQGGPFHQDAEASNASKLQEGSEVHDPLSDHHQLATELSLEEYKQ